MCGDSSILTLYLIRRTVEILRIVWIQAIVLRFEKHFNILHKLSMSYVSALECNESRGRVQSFNNKCMQGSLIIIETRCRFMKTEKNLYFVMVNIKTMLHWSMSVVMISREIENQGAWGGGSCH